MEEQEQVSMTIEDYDDKEDILDDAATSQAKESSDHGIFAHFSRNGMIRIGKEAGEYKSMEAEFLMGMKQYASDTQVVAVHKNMGFTPAMLARFAAFTSFERAILQKSGGRGHAKVNHGWFGASKEEIIQIISYGFSRCNGQSHGLGVYLSPIEFLLDGVEFTSADENGMRYMLLCHLTMGNMEVIPAGSKQIYPSSVEFDTGVDNLEAPRRLIVWRAFMNSHICPAYIITFKFPSFGTCSLRNQTRKLHGPTLCFQGRILSFPALFSILIKVFGPAKGDLISQSLDEYKKCKITRLQLIQNVRRIIENDQLLLAVIKSNIDKWEHVAARMAAEATNDARREWHSLLTALF
ncbi:unnamed protein product [Dovyalis caffra]|uniref:Poly [ADP-ribose] polymerase n=1 Tax=Dovyalis caffra TaxID=77055 RepID=A0AAV1SJW5_9ROSI|nr:unnamed protein product [Dovyalis caffra]